MKLIAKLYNISCDDLLFIENDLKITIPYVSDKDIYKDCPVDKQILSSYEAVNKYSQNEVDGFLISATCADIADSIIDELYSYGVKREDIYLIFRGPDGLNIVCLSEYNFLPYIEYHVADHCNLNCKGCVHFSSLVKNKSFSNYEEVKRDLTRLKTIVPYIGEIHILGGEPLLNSDLEKYLVLTRKIYPYSRIMVVTNGLLVRRMRDSLVDSFVDNEIEMSISLYKPMFAHLDDTVAFLREKSIVYHCSNPISEFAYTFDESGGHASSVRKLSCSCPNLYRGKLAICPPIAYAQYFNSAFEDEFSIPEDQGVIDIYDENMTYDKMIELLHKPVPICDKCLFVSKEDMIPFDWEQSCGVDINDFVFKG